MNAIPLTRDEAVRRARLVFDVSYDIELDLSGDDTSSFASTTRVRFGCADPDQPVHLDLVAEEVESLEVNGTTREPAFADGRISLTGLEASNDVVVRARCGYSRSGVGLHRFVDPVDDQVFCYTQFEPQDARRVFACFDQPDIKGRFTISALARPGWTVVSNGEVTSRPAQGRGGRWSFAETPPIPTYITALVAGPYHRVDDEHDGMSLSIYCRRSMAPYLDPDEVFGITKAGLDWFAEFFDQPYPFTTYDQLFVPEFNFGAMENPGCVTFSERYIFRSRVTQAARLSRANTILHEMAHMWFGDQVTMRWWDDLWLNESFATFMAHTAVAEATRFGRDSWADFAHSLKAWAYQQDQLPSTHPIVAEVADTDTVMANFDGITYAKGASVLKQLHAWVGPDPFRQGIRDYFDTHAWGNAELADFLRALEGPSGRDLQPWARSWLQTAGVATLSAELALVEDGEAIGSLTIRQDVPEDHPTLRPHRLAIGSYDTVDGQLRRTDLTHLDVTGERTDVPALVGRTRPDLLLVNDEDLAYAKVRLDEHSVQTLERSLGTLADGVARAVCWGSLWDATRDAELAARRFADLVCEHGPVEADISVLQTLLRQAFACAERYGDPGNRVALRHRIAEVARAGLARAEPGSDRQLVWVRSIISSRTDPDWVRGLLDGSVTVPDLPIEPDLRWFAVSHLAAAGEIEEAGIAAELESDPTDVGRRGAETARAARPVSEAKKAAWQRALDTDLAMHTRLAALRGFWQVEQAELLADYVRSGWVEALPRLWRDVAAEEGLSMTHAIYPHVIVDQSVVEAADRALRNDLTPLAQRAIAEGRDGTQRALRARAVDR